MIKSRINSLLFIHYFNRRTVVQFIFPIDNHIFIGTDFGNPDKVPF